MESTIKKIVWILGFILIPVTIQAGSITITSPSRNITAEFRGAMLMQSPTINITVNGRKISLTVNELLSIRDIGNTVFNPPPMGTVDFKFFIQQ